MSILCQSGTPVIKKLLCFALTVTLSVGKKMNCSPPSARLDEGFVSLTLRRFKTLSCNHSAILPDKIDSLFLALMDVRGREAGDILP